MFNAQQAYKNLEKFQQKNSETNIKQTQPVLNLMKNSENVEKKSKIHQNIPNSRINEFSAFATQMQRQLDLQQVYIQQVINEAIQSHLQKMKNIIELSEEIEQEQKLAQQQLKNFFTNKSSWGEHLQFNNFLKNPIQYSLNEIARTKQFDFVGSIRQFIRRSIRVQRFALIQNKVIKIQNLRLKDYFIHENKYLVPTEFQNTFVAFENQKIPFYVFYNGLSYETKQNLMKLSPSDRKTIIEMVVLFLKKKQVIVQGDQIGKIIDSKVKSI